MLRLGPTAITLGDGDLRDFRLRAQRRQEEVRENNRILKKSGVCAEDIQRFNTRAQQSDRPAVEPFNPSLNLPFRSTEVGSATQPQRAYDSTTLLDPFSEETENLESLAGSQGLSMLTLSPETPGENAGQESYLQSSPPKNDDFHYGGFMESPNEDHTQTRSPSFDISTPPQHEPLARLRPRERLPRSPLYLSHNASNSPEHRPTSGLTPRVVSRVANHNTPGMMFAQPPRRGQARIFRHQTNSFSFDSSERSSAVYEQERPSSASTDGSTSLPRRHMSLDDELEGASLNRSRTNSDEPSPELDTVTADNYHLVLPHDFQEDPRRFTFSSPQLPLPPPFSTVPRAASREGAFNHPQTSPVAIPTSSPPRSNPEEEQMTPRPMAMDVDMPQVTPTASPSRNLTPNGIMARMGSRVRSLYRARSPVSLNRLPGAPSSPQRSMPMVDFEPRSTPQPRPDPLEQIQQMFRIYDDTLSPEDQPQTPANLPEARHRSRFNSTYTAPVDGRNLGRRTRIHIEQPDFATPTRRPVGRSGSPVGVMTDGFQGLYGGRENGDDQRNWVEGVRTDMEEARLLGSRDARNDGRGLNDTPEREEFRPGH